MQKAPAGGDKPLRTVDPGGQHWLRLSLSGDKAEEQRVPAEEWQRFQAPDWFCRAVAAIVQPGTTIVVTPDSLASGDGAAEVTVIDSE